VPDEAYFERLEDCGAPKLFLRSAFSVRARVTRGHCGKGIEGRGQLPQ
jgi:hypothetical protein